MLMLVLVLVLVLLEVGEEKKLCESIQGKTKTRKKAASGAKINR